MWHSHVEDMWLSLIQHMQVQHTHYIVQSKIPDHIRGLQHFLTICAMVDDVGPNIWLSARQNQGCNDWWYMRYVGPNIWLSARQNQGCNDWWYMDIWGMWDLISDFLQGRIRGVMIGDIWDMWSNIWLCKAGSGVWCFISGILFLYFLVPAIYCMEANLW